MIPLFCMFIINSFVYINCIHNWDGLWNQIYLWPELGLEEQSS